MQAGQDLGERAGADDRGEQQRSCGAAGEFDRAAGADAQEWIAVDTDEFVEWDLEPHPLLVVSAVEP